MQKLFSSEHVQWQKFQEFEKILCFHHDVTAPNIIFDNYAAVQSGTK